MNTQKPIWTAAEVQNFMAGIVPQMMKHEPFHVVEEVSAAGARVRQVFHERSLRAGNTISGTALMTLGDLAVYAALLAIMGEAGKGAVTTNFAVNFLRRPPPGDVIAEVRLLSRGSRLAVAEVDFMRPGEDRLLARATGTYFLGESQTYK